MTPKKVLVTFGDGPLAEALEISRPLMERYARRHGYGFVDATSRLASARERFSGSFNTRPSSWQKIPVCAGQFDYCGANVVLWIDADVVIVRGDVDIATQANPCRWMSMVVQRTPDGSVPSCGVMVLRSFCGHFPEDIWNAAGPDGNGLVRSGCWWEQAAVIKALGGDPDPTPIVTPPESDLWGELPYEWNPHPMDARGIPEDCRFFHATACTDRIGEMKKWAAKANW